MARPCEPAPWDCAHCVAATRRAASIGMSKRRCAVTRSSRSSSGVSKSKSNVPIPAAFKTEATSRLRGLWRLLPLPCANSTKASPAPTVVRMPSRTQPGAAMRISAEDMRASGGGRELRSNLVAQRPRICRSEEREEPCDRELGGHRWRARLLEVVRGARDHGELARAAHARISLAIDLEHVRIALAHDEQRGRGYELEIRTREIGASATRHHRAHALVLLRGGDEGGRRTRAGAEIPQRCRARIAAGNQILGRPDEAPREEPHVETQVAHVPVGRFLLGGEQVEQ